MILVLQHRKDRLPDFLATLASYQPVTVDGGDTAGSQILDVMQNLLLYW